MRNRVVLLGHDIGYSASPAIQNAAFEALGLPLRYEVRDVAPARLASTVAELRVDGLAGANVTQPHKVAVLELVDALAPEVRRIGAANTLVRDDGRITAHNTDAGAIAAELTDLTPSKPRSAVILGSGGASRAVESALVAKRCREVIVVRRDNWASLELALAGADLLVNATPIGTGSDETPVRGSWLRADLAVLDLVYRPSPTRLVRDARAAGAQARGGAGVLLRQAAASLTLWTGVTAPLDVMRAALQTELGEGADV